MAAATTIVACASAQMSRQAQTTGAPPVQQTMPGDESLEHKQINDLAQQIAAERGQLPVPTAVQLSTPVATCVRNTSATCTQTCQLTDSICANADKICEIAKKLQGDDWADKKCTENRTTCTTATTQCCECTP